MHACRLEQTAGLQAVGVWTHSIRSKNRMAACQNCEVAGCYWLWIVVCLQCPRLCKVAAGKPTFSLSHCTYGTCSGGWSAWGCTSATYCGAMDEVNGRYGCGEAEMDALVGRGDDAWCLPGPSVFITSIYCVSCLYFVCLVQWCSSAVPVTFVLLCPCSCLICAAVSAQALRAFCNALHAHGTNWPAAQHLG